MDSLMMFRSSWIKYFCAKRARHVLWMEWEIRNTLKRSGTDRRGRSFPLRPPAPSTRTVLCSSDLGRYPCLLMTTSLHPHTRRWSSSRHFAAVYRLPTAMTHFEDTHRHSRLPGDKKETGRAALTDSAQLYTKYRSTCVFSEFINRHRG